MYIERVPNRNSPPAVLLRESNRENGKVVKTTVANLSALPDHIIENIRAALKNNVVPATSAIADPSAVMSLENGLPHGHVAAVLGSLRKCGLEKCVDARPSRQRDIIVALIADRLISGGSSKLSTVRHCRAETASHSLGSLLNLEEITDAQCYEAMDWLLQRQENIQKKLAKKHLKKEGSDSVLFDLTSSYFEGTQCPLAKRGYSRDHRGDKCQVNYGMYCTADGTPIGVEVFPGNESDRVAFPVAVERVRKDFKKNHVIFVGDRGMIGGKIIDETLRHMDGAQWITALQNVSVAKLERQGSIQLSIFDERDLMTISDPAYPDERLVVCRNPQLADKRKHTREELLLSTEKLIESVQKKIQRVRNPIHGSDAIGVALGKIIDKKKVAKHFDIHITDDSLTVTRNQEKIDAEAACDGLYVIRSNVSENELSEAELVENYKNLQSVERAFHSFKSVDIRVRPIHHFKENRVRAHIFICMLTYYVERHMRNACAEILFTDTDKPQRTGKDIVRPAQRSRTAQIQDGSKRTDEDFPLSSFHDMLASMSGMVRARIHIRGHKSQPFWKTSVPTMYQKKIIELLEISRHM